jgi:flagellar motor switch protein FliN/FliY
MSEPSGEIDQQEIEKLLQQAQNTGEQQATVEPGAEAAPASPTAASVNSLIDKATDAINSLDEPGEPDVVSKPELTDFKLADLSGTPAPTEKSPLDVLRDVELDLKIELGRTQMYLEDVLRLRKGAVVALDKLAGDPVDVYVNGRLIARGEVLVLNDNFCVRVAELVAGDAVA